MVTQNRRFIGNMLLVGLILLIPVMAGFPWTQLDYVFAGVVLTATVVACEVVLRKVTGTLNRIAFIGGILALLMLIWAWAVA